MNAQDDYARKRTTPEAAAATVASGSTLSMGMAMAEPPALLGALAERAETGDLEALNVYYYHATANAGDTLLRYELTDRITPFCMFLSNVERDLINRADADERKVVHYVPNNFHQSVRFLTEYVAVDTFVMTVSPMDRHGYFSLGTGNDYSSTVACAAGRLIVEVNEYMPRVFGAGAALHVSEIDAIVEHPTPLLELPTADVADDDRAIGDTIAELVPDGACLQMGVGSLPNFICSQLSGHNDLGIHTESLSPGLAELIHAGVVNNSRKTLDRGRSVFTFALGQCALYDLIDDNPGIWTAPVTYVNDPSVIAQNNRMISVNTALQIDLTGAVNAEHLLGHQFSATGGQVDFARGAYASAGGQSIIACPAAAAHGKVSRIVATLDGPVTTPRTDVHRVVTEYGWTDLKGKSSSERAQALIELAHPDFREELRSQARERHLI
jgi:itaconate CoA-transferase